MTLSKPSSDTILTIGTTGEVPTIKAGGTNTDLKLEATGSGGNLYFYASSSLKMIVRNDGNVGIGTASPDQKLVIANSSGSVYQKLSADFGNAFIGMETSDDSYRFLTAQATPIQFYTNNALALTIASTGAATFASSVTAAGVSNSGEFTSTQGNNTRIFYSGTATTGYQYMSFKNTSGQLLIGVEGSAAGSLQTGNSAYSTVITTVGATDLSLGTNQVEKMRITSGGNVGIGTTSPTGKLHSYIGDITAGNAPASSGTTPVNAMLNLTNNRGVGMFFGGSYAGNYGQWIQVSDVGNLGVYYPLYLNPNGGNVLIGTTTDSGARIDARMTVAGKPVISAINTNATDSRCYYGQKYNSSTDDYYMIFDNVVANKFLFYGNGGLGNVQANDLNISDIRTKKDITPLESYWDKFKAIEIVKFKYKDQIHDDFNIGVIAQQIEEVAPEFVDAEDWGKNAPVETEEPLKSIYTADLYHATIKVLQEAMAKIETLESRITQLENK